MTNGVLKSLSRALMPASTCFWYKRPPALWSATTRCWSSALDEPKRVLFLGTPQAAAIVLDELLRASSLPGSIFEVAAVVTRPSSRAWMERNQGMEAAAPAREIQRSKQPQEPLPANNQPGSGGPLSPLRLPALSPASRPSWSHHSASPVEQLALAHGFSGDRILCPVSAKEPAFLDTVRQLRPTLAVTAAYGALLPQAFLDLPTFGTINIHPSLLPRYRGPAPVQRALLDGCSTTGVSLVCTVLKCDAGPLLAQEQVPVPPDLQAPQFTEQLFRHGAGMLLRQLPGLLTGAVTAEHGAPQDEAAATYAPKVTKDEALLDFRRSAAACHHQVRALAGWPGSKAALLVEKERGTGRLEPMELKVLHTHVVEASHPVVVAAASVTAGTNALLPGAGAQVLCTTIGELLVPCGDGNYLSILEVGKRRGAGNKKISLNIGGVPAKELITGLGKRRLFLPTSV